MLSKAPFIPGRADMKIRCPEDSKMQPDSMVIVSVMAQNSNA
jgi:hypothetical protein